MMCNDVLTVEPLCARLPLSECPQSLTERTNLRDLFVTVIEIHSSEEVSRHSPSLNMRVYYISVPVLLLRYY